METIMKTINFTDVEFFVVVATGKTERRREILHRSLTEYQALRHLKREYPHLNIVQVRIRNKCKKTFEITIEDFLQHSREIGV